MSRYVITINTPESRAYAIDIARAAPLGTRVEFRGPKRSLEQNARMWAMLSDIARQLKYHGRKRTTYQWCALFLDALPTEAEWVPSLDGASVVNIARRSSSELSKQEMSDLMELMSSFGAEHDVKFSDLRIER